VGKEFRAKLEFNREGKQILSDHRKSLLSFLLLLSSPSCLVLVYF